MFFSKWPVAHALSASPSTDTGKPYASDWNIGCDNHAKAATRTNPLATRRRATTSAYRLGNIGVHRRLSAAERITSSALHTCSGEIARMLASDSVVLLWCVTAAGLR